MLHGVLGFTGRASDLVVSPSREPKGRDRVWNLLNLPNLSRGGFLNFAMKYHCCFVPWKLFKILQQGTASQGTYQCGGFPGPKIDAPQRHQRTGILRIEHRIHKHAVRRPPPHSV